ncbi:MAG: DUF21 domain-containing protein [Actinobacteria bacterium]|nr:DUF21 domain-containing protein [Actinomycetota bacterium]
MRRLAMSMGSVKSPPPSPAAAPQWRAASASVWRRPAWRRVAACARPARQASRRGAARRHGPGGTARAAGRGHDGHPHRPRALDRGGGAMSAAVLLAYAAMALASLGASAFFAGVETGAYTVNRLRLAVRADRGEHGARVLIGELSRANRWLATLLIGNTLAGDAASYAIGTLLDGAGISHGAAMALNAAILLPLIVVLGETLPKELFRQHADSWMVVVAPLARWVRVALGATGAVALVRWLGDALARRLAPCRPVQRCSRVMKPSLPFSTAASYAERACSPKVPRLPSTSPRST